MSVYPDTVCMCVSVCSCARQKSVCRQRRATEGKRAQTDTVTPTLPSSTHTACFWICDSEKKDCNGSRSGTLRQKNWWNTQVGLVYFSHHISLFQNTIRSNLSLLFPVKKAWNEPGEWTGNKSSFTSLTVSPKIPPSVALKPVSKETGATLLIPERQAVKVRGWLGVISGFTLTVKQGAKQCVRLHTCHVDYSQKWLMFKSKCDFFGGTELYCSLSSVTR